MAQEIAGYRTLSDDEVNAVNYVTESVGGILTKMFSDLEDVSENENTELWLDRRWVAIARRHFQQGLMAYTRAITKPGGF
jgi:hypothetical protein